MATDLTQEFCALRDTYIEKQFGRLNEMQRRAVFTTDGPLLILAGAGSGKTTVLVNRIANLIRFGAAHGSKQLPRPATEEDVKALRSAIMTGTAAPGWLDGMLRQNAVRSWNVMAITFTNKAAGEMKERLRRMLGGEEGDEVFASTFHSACVRILRRWAEEIGYPRSFTIYDTDDAQRVMKAVYKDLNVDDKFFPIKSAINQMSRWKDQLVSPEQALANPAKDTKGALAARIYAAYEKRLKEAGAFDFDDLIYQTVQLLAEHPDVRDFYQTKYKYLLVDEYQDTSVAQFRLVSLLTGPERNICVVGDDDQSIYRFRGATIENILNFEKCYPGAKTIRLEQNYRSTSNILNAANCVIQHNTERKGKTLWTDNGEGDKVQVYTAENEQDEAMHIADVIGQHLKEGGHLADHAILYRMNAQSAPIESYFTRAGIPHKIVGGQRFNDRKEVKDIHSYMSIVANPRDDVRLRRIINEPARKIGNTTVEVIADLAAQQGVSMLEIIGHADQYAKLSRAVMPLLKFWQIYQSLQDSLETKTLDAFAADVIERTGYKAMLEADAAKPADPGPAGEQRQELLRPARRGRHAGGLSGRYRPHQRHRQLQRERRPGGADDHPFGQGAGVPLCVPHRYGRGRVPQRDEQVFRGGPGRRAPPCLRRHHPRQKGTVHLQQRHPHALRPHPAQRAQPLFARDRAGVHRRDPQPGAGTAFPSGRLGQQLQRHRARRRVRVLRAFRLGPQRRGLRFRRLWFPLRRRLPEPRVQRRGAQRVRLRLCRAGHFLFRLRCRLRQQFHPAQGAFGRVRCRVFRRGRKDPGRKDQLYRCTGCQGSARRLQALRAGRHRGAQGLWPGHRAQGQACGRRPDRGDQL